MTDWLKVGATVIPVAPGSGHWDWNDAVDRARRFDNSYSASSSGGAARDFHFTTPPVTLALASTYRAALQNVAAQLCTGDVMEIPTMCCAELVSETPVRLSVGHRVVLDFALHEVQPKKLLLKYTPGDTLAGESFTRSTTATYTNSSGFVATAAINAKRDSHYIGSVRSLLREDSRQNICLQSQDFATTWSPTAATVTANTGNGADGTATADKLKEDNTNAAHKIGQAITCASVAQSFSVWAVAAERSKVVVSMSDNTTGAASVGVDLTNGTTFATGIAVGSWTNISSTVTQYASGYYRITITATRGAGTQTLPEIYLWTTALSYVGTTGSGLFLWGGQLEIGAFPSSYIPTTTVPVTRGADLYSLPHTIPPGEATILIQFVELGTYLVAGGRAFQISNAADAGPALRCFATGTKYTTQHENAVTTSTSGLATSPALNDIVVLLDHFYGDGNTDITQTLNGGAPTASVGAGAITPASAWSGPLVWLGSGGSAAGIGFAAIQSFKIMAGARSLTEMLAA